MERIPVDRIIEKVDRLFDKNDYAEAGRLLEYWRDEARTIKDTRGELAIENELVGYYRKQKEAQKGLESIERALVLVDELGQSTMASGATVLLNCATAYNAFAMTDKSLPLYERAEDVYKNVLEANDSRFGGLYNNMALTLVDLGRFDDAEIAYKKALAVMEKAERGELECAITYVNLAHMYEETEEAAKVIECMEKARILLDKKEILHDGYYAFVLEKCAPSFAYFGDSETSEKYLKESREIYARA